MLILKKYEMISSMTPRNNKFSYIWNKDNNLIMLLLFISILAVYYLPFIFNQILFLFFIFLAYISKKDYFWIAFFFILLDAPGRLFSGGARSDLHRMAFYYFGSGITLSFNDLFLLAYFFKAFNLNKKYNFVFKNDFVRLLFYTLAIVIYSFLLGISSDNVIKLMRTLLPWILIYVIPIFLDDEQDFIKLNRLLFPIVLLSLPSQIFTYITGSYLGYFLKGFIYIPAFYLVTEESEYAARAEGSVYIILFCLSQALFYLSAKKKIFPNTYLYLIVFASALSIFLTATRGWILGFSFIILMSFLIFPNVKTIKIFIKIGLAGFVVIAVLISLYPLIKVQARNTVKRLSTMQDLAEGDVTAGGTLRRVNIRMPRVMNKFKESPILGWGFSNEYFKFADAHVSHSNVLLNVGIVGYIILNYFFFKWCFSIFRLSRCSEVKKNYGNAVQVLGIVLFGTFIIHSSSVQFWGLNTSNMPVIFYTLFFGFFNVLALKSRTSPI